MHHHLTHALAHERRRELIADARARHAASSRRKRRTVVAAVLAGGTGNDTASYGNADRGVIVSKDGLANDGRISSVSARLAMKLDGSPAGPCAWTSRRSTPAGVARWSATPGRTRSRRRRRRQTRRGGG